MPRPRRSTDAARLLRRLSPAQLLVVGVLLVGLYLFRGPLGLVGEPAERRAESPPATPTERSTGDAGRDAGGSTLASGVSPELDDAIVHQRSGVWVTASGRIDRILPDDRDGSAHQRFIVRLADGRTILVAHNIDLAAKVPIDRGDTVRLRGRFEWNDRGGVIHWTHHDPDRPSRDAGWIEFDGRRYD